VNASVSPNTPRKDRRDAASKTKGKRRRYSVNILAITLDINKEVEELKKEALEEEEKTDMLVVEVAIKLLFGEKKSRK